MLRDSRVYLHIIHKRAFEDSGISFNLSNSEVWYLKGITTIHSSTSFTAAYLNIGEKLRELLKLSFEEVKLKAKSFIKSFSLVYEIKKKYKNYFNNRKSISKLIPINRYVFLKQLRYKKIKIGIVSNAGIKLLKKDLGEEFNLFDVVIGGEDVNLKKPSPEGILKAIQILNVKPLQTIYVGDTEIDAMAANSADVKFIPVATGMVKPRWWRNKGYEPISDVSYLISFIN